MSWQYGGMNRNAVHHIIATLTPEAIEASLDVSPHSVRAAKTKGEFPSNWYAGLKALCDEVGIPCPLSAFYWRASDKKLSIDRAQVKGQCKSETAGAA